MKQAKTHTPKINPLMGLFGFFGFAGFLPLIFDAHQPSPFHLIFFVFFGFFRFYYDGKMSNILIDERYMANHLRATSIANSTAVSIIMGGVIILGKLVRYIELYTLTSLLVVVIALALALAGFLEAFLLYKFETEE
ncbi:MAG: hypothetical protein ATN34_03865 [Epulopiscium sp. Nele67-Bin002]|nr:MAG: hypothetical protein ATN33_01035 [Epulopiscium sp. Nele67-Bin001]OON92610.1 MAG: hypothetical protein ATN34_03865 [Epulopiscium sp. Nele67-Bin002]